MNDKNTLYDCIICVKIVERGQDAERIYKDDVVEKRRSGGVEGQRRIQWKIQNRALEAVNAGRQEG